MFKVELISIGNELLNGFTINSNASWLGQKLSKSGYIVKWGTTIPDEKELLETAFKTASNRADIILVTGGLGPTHDDITKSVICSYFNLQLALNKKALKNVEGFFARRKRQMNEIGRMQAYLPEGAIVLTNSVGTASGIGIESEESLFIFMPGVPAEMQNIMLDEGLDLIRKKYPAKSSQIVNLKTTGIYESKLSEKISDILKKADEQIAVAFLPKITGVTLRFTAPAVRDNELTKLVTVVKSRIEKYIFSENDENLEEVVGRLLIEKKKTVALAESCTGGLISHLLTNIPGSSAYFLCTHVTYSNEAKISELGVSPKIIENQGAVSEEVAIQMAENVRMKFKTDFGIGITGIAGPGGGTEEKPVGLVYASLAVKDKTTIINKFQFGNDRKTNKLQSAIAVLEMLRRELLGIN